MVDMETNAPSNDVIIPNLVSKLQDATWEHDALRNVIQNVADELNIKFKDIAMIIRRALSNRDISPSIFDMMLLLEQKETIARLEHFQNGGVLVFPDNIARIFEHIDKTKNETRR